MHGMRSMSQLFHTVFGSLRRTFSSIVDSAVRKMGRLTAIALLVASVAPARADTQWVPLEQAITTAKAGSRIILLYVRTAGRDEKTDEWIARLDSHEALRALLNDVVLATREDRNRRSPQLLTQSIQFMAWKLRSRSIDTRHKLHCFLPNTQILE